VGVGHFVIEARPIEGGLRWRGASELMPCSPLNRSRKSAEAELDVRQEAARFRRLELRVTCLEPDERELERQRAAKLPGADGQGPVTLAPKGTRAKPAPVKAKK
jgi:hypothetical protein